MQREVGEHRSEPLRELGGIEGAEPPRFDPRRCPTARQTTGNQLREVPERLRQSTRLIGHHQNSLDSDRVAEGAGSPFPCSMLRRGEAGVVRARYEHYPARDSRHARHRPGMLSRARPRCQASERGLPRSPVDAQPPQRGRSDSLTSREPIGLIGHRDTSLWCADRGGASRVSRSRRDRGRRSDASRPDPRILVRHRCHPLPTSVVIGSPSAAPPLYLDSAVDELGSCGLSYLLRAKSHLFGTELIR